MRLISFFIITIITLNLNLYAEENSKEEKDCYKHGIYIRCLDGFYKRINTINPLTNEPIFEGKTVEDNLEDLSFYFKKFTYYSIKLKKRKAIRYEYYKNSKKAGEFYFVFYQGKLKLKKAMWYNQKGRKKEVHNYYDKLPKPKIGHIDTFLYYNDFGVLVRKEVNTFLKNKLLKREITSDFIIDSEIFASSEY